MSSDGDLIDSAAASFKKMGTSYQQKVVVALLTDLQYAEQMHEVIRPKYFDTKYLEVIVEKFYEHKERYKTYPSFDLINIMIANDVAIDVTLKDQANAFIVRAAEEPLNGDKGFIEESSLDFCRKQVLKEAIIVTLDKIEESKYDDIQTIIKDALKRGSSQDLGQDYIMATRSRAQRSERKPIPTGWPVVDKILNGGWERKTLTSFIAPTGAGKSMFLVNCSAAGVMNGMNSVYITCEMADYKIGLRHDSYFSGIEINSVPDHTDHVERSISEKVKGRLFIKEFGTKTASVQTIRSYLQRLQATKEFTPDIIVVDYADLLRSAKGYGEKRHELESVYEDLRALSQEFNAVVITADQTNRSGLNDDVVTLSSIAEAYAKATVCDLIFTVSRKAEDRQTNSGRIFVAKSRLGQDGMVHPFVMNSATVKATILDQGADPIAMFMENNKNLQEKFAERLSGMIKKKESSKN